MLQNLLENPQRLFGLVLTPTRELAFQIAEQFEALGKSIGVKCGVLVGKIFGCSLLKEHYQFFGLNLANIFVKLY